MKPLLLLISIFELIWNCFTGLDGEAPPVGHPSGCTVVVKIIPILARLNIYSPRCCLT